MSTARAAAELALGRIHGDTRDGVWIRVLDDDDVLAAADEVDRRVAAGGHLPLAGATLAVKDNMDLAGIPTTAGCPAYAYTPHRTATVVARLVEAGAVVVGKTNMDQFATGLVGIRSPYGITPNARWPGRIAGGSSSGSAVAVAAGLVDLALGTDTAGSGRVPAACNGIVGLKPTRGRLSSAGVVPACRSLDCVSVFATDVDRARLVASIAAAPDDADPWSRTAPPSGHAPAPGRAPRIGVARPGDLTFDGDPDGSARHAAAVERLVATGVEVVEIGIGPFLEVSDLLYGASFVAERYEAIGEFLERHPDDVHPVVASIIGASRRFGAWEVFRDRTELARLARVCAPVWDVVDAIVVPTVPRVPTIDEVLAEPVAVNTMLGTYTNFVNLLDLAAVTFPVGSAAGDGPPPSLTIVGPAWSDDALVSLAEPLGTPAILRGA
ncbi:MAG: allophanate hydrolase [Ilumatobacteraceae bacterium]